MKEGTDTQILPWAPKFRLSMDFSTLSFLTKRLGLCLIVSVKWNPKYCRMVSPSQYWHYGPFTFKQKIVLDTLILRDRARQKKEQWATSERKCCTEQGRRKTAFHLKEFPQHHKKCSYNIRCQIQPINWPYFYISGIKEELFENWHRSKF